jgi:hypothetical protein
MSSPCVDAWDHDANPATACMPWATCAAGTKVAAAGTAIADRTCAACASGTFSATSNAASCTAFSDCAAGTRVSAEGTTSADRTCEACASGSFSATANTATCATYTPCAAGTAISAAGTSSADQTCAACAQGTFSAANASSCTPFSSCPAGTQVSAAGTATNDRTCAACTAGTFSTTANTVSCTAFTPCAIGSIVSTAGTATSDQVCSVDPTWPARPAGVTATSVSEARVDLTWSAAANASSYLVSYAVETGSPTPPGPVLAAEGPSPLTVSSGTSLSVTELPRGRYTFTVTAVDARSRQSAPSAGASAASRWWNWEAGSPTNNYARTVAAVNTGTFVAGGSNGAIWTTSNGGVTWANRWLGPHASTVVKVVSTDTSVLAYSYEITTTTVSGRLHRSTDAGATWTMLTLPLTLNPVNAAATIWASGKHVVVLADYGHVLVSADSGATFTPVALGNSFFAVGMVGSGSTVMLFSDSGNALRSTDAGLTWAAMTDLNGLLNASGRGYGAWVEGQKGVVGFKGGTLRYTTDGGATWLTPTGNPLTRDITNVFGAGSTVFAVSSYDTGVPSAVAVSTDGGATWKACGTLQTTTDLLTVGWTDGTNAIIASPNGSQGLVSTDQGATFTYVGGVPYGITAFASDGATLVTATQSRPPNGPLVHTTNIAQKWPAAFAGAYSGKATFFNAGTEVRSAWYGSSFSSHDNGDSWATTLLSNACTSLGGDGSVMLMATAKSTGDTISTATPPTGAWQVTKTWPMGGPANLSAFAGAGTTWVAVARSGHLVRTTDSGATWSIVGTFTPPTINDRDPGLKASGSTFIAYSSAGLVLRSSDSGATFSAQTVGAANFLSAVVESNVVVLGASDGSVAVSTDNGATFAPPRATGLANVSSLWRSGTTLLAGGEASATAWPVGAGIALSTDSGAHWSSVWNNPRSYSGFAAFTGSATELIAFGHGMPVRSLDLGVTWAAAPTTHFVGSPPGTVEGANAAELLIDAAFTLSDGTPIAFDAAGGALTFGPR